MVKKTKEELAASNALTKSKKPFWDAMEEGQVAQVASYLTTNPEWVNREDGHFEFYVNVGTPGKFDQITKSLHRFVNPLQYAAAHGMTEMVAMLLQHGADIYDASEAGYTGLGYAQLYGHYDAKMLIKAAVKAKGGRRA